MGSKIYVGPSFFLLCAAYYAFAQALQQAPLHSARECKHKNNGGLSARLAIYTDAADLGEMNMAAALLYSARSASLNATVFASPNASNRTESLLSSWYPSIGVQSAFSSHACNYSTIVLTALSLAKLPIIMTMQRLQCRHQRLIIALTAASQVANLGKLRSVRRWRVQFLTPTARIWEDTKAVLDEHGIQAPVEMFFPVFEVNTSCLASEGKECLSEERTGVILEGSRVAERNLFLNLTSAYNGRAPNLRLALEQHDLQSPISEHSSVHTARLLQYHRLIASSKGLLVLSPTVKYEEIWTAISAAVSCSTPVIAKADVQQAFPFLIQDAMVSMENGTREAVRRGSALSEGQLEAKIIAMDAVKSKLMLQNQLLMYQLARQPASLAQLVQCNSE